MLIVRTDAKLMDINSHKTFENLDVLVVDDNLDGREVVQLLLEDKVHRIDTASDGREALNLLEAHQYHVVFMDCQMPYMDGYEVTKILRQREGETQHTQVIGLSANVGASNREKCLAVGMDAFLEKPALFHDIVAALEEVTTFSSH